MNYKSIKSLYLECCCSDISLREWGRLMIGSKQANKKEVDKLVKLYLPKLYSQLALNHYNPYIYYRTKTHLILIHSGIEYFLRFK